MNGPQGVWRDLLHQISSSIEGTKQAKTIAEYLNVAPKETSDWQKFQLGVSEEALYDDDQLVTNILHSMVKLITCFHDFWMYDFFFHEIFFFFVFLNFGHSEKHKEIEKIFHLNLTLLMPCPFTCQTKNLFTYCGSHKHFVLDKKMICIQ